MKKNKIVLLPLLLLISACSTSQYSEKKIIEEAKVENTVKNTDESQTMILEIINSDTTVQETERNKIIALINKSYSEYKEVEVLIHQKKALLIKEYIKGNPNKSKIQGIQSAIKKSYSKKSAITLECFDEISKIIKLHPQSSTKFFNRADSFWPMRDRAL